MTGWRLSIRAGSAPRARLVLAATAAAAAAAAALAQPGDASAELTTFSPSGAWTYFTEPRAINHEGRHRRTYVGWIDADGRIFAASYDHRTHVRTRAVLRSRFQIDDHDDPSITVRPDGRLLAFYSAHRGRNLFYRLSRRPEDVTAWGPERVVDTNVPGRHGYTYPNPIWLSEEPRPLFLFWRGGSFEPVFSTSRNGSSWSPATKLIDGAGDRPYLAFHSNGRDTIHIVFTDGNPGSRATGVYYVVYRDGRFEGADGRFLGTVADLPLEISQADRVYSVEPGGRPSAWGFDVGVGGDGRPVVLYATFPSRSDHRYNYARWNGVGWVSREMTAAGPTMDRTGTEDHYSGGLVFDSRDASVVYMSRQVDGVFQIERWTTPNSGATWSTSRITSGSAGSYRPASVLGPSFGEDHDLFWMSGRYTGWRDFGTSIRTRVPDGAGSPPDADFEVLSRRTQAGRPVSLGVVPRAARGVHHRWDFGDSTRRARGDRAVHTYARRGVYPVTLTATDRRGRRNVFVRELRIERRGRGRR